MRHLASLLAIWAGQGRILVANFLSRGWTEIIGKGAFRAELHGGSTWANSPMMLAFKATQAQPHPGEAYEQVAGAQTAAERSGRLLRSLPSITDPCSICWNQIHCLIQNSCGTVDARRRPVSVAPDAQELRVWENPDVLPRVLTATESFSNRICPERSRMERWPGGLRTTVVLQHLPQTGPLSR